MTNTISILQKREEKALRKQKQKESARERRRKFIGKAKGVDHGQPGVVTYQLQEGAEKSGLPDRTKPFTVLGIESSCDDTGAAVVRSDGAILGEALASQHDIHEEWGGVVPGLARDAHVAKIDGIVNLALERAGLDSMEQVDAIGVTVGPGLEICLRVGATKARELALQYKKPFVGVHHLEAHILMARLPLMVGTASTSGSNSSTSNVVHIPATSERHASIRALDFPFLALLVSGGHCQILNCLDIGKYTILGGTMDDSLGEAFDKVARLLGLPVGGGGGPAVEALAKQGDPTSVRLPVPLQNKRNSRDNLDFSFAGLKTAVRRAAEKLCGADQDGNVTGLLTEEDKANIAASFQHVAMKHIEQRLERAMKLVDKQAGDRGSPTRIRSLVVVGGVAANEELRSRLEALCDRLSENEEVDDAINREKEGIPTGIENHDSHSAASTATASINTNGWKMFVPPPRLCTDQGSMSAWAAIERLYLKASSDDPTTQEVHARYPFALEHDTK